MTLLWLNTIMMASSAMVWVMWSRKWATRKQPLFSALYAVSAVGAGMAAYGFTLVLLSGDPHMSASMVRWWVWAFAALPAFTRLLELIREERREGFADRVMGRAERRADTSDRRASLAVETHGGD